MKFVILSLLLAVFVCDISAGTLGHQPGYAYGYAPSSAGWDQGWSSGVYGGGWDSPLVTLARIPSRIFGLVRHSVGRLADLVRPRGGWGAPAHAEWAPSGHAHAHHGGHSVVYSNGADGWGAPAVAENAWEGYGRGGHGSRGYGFNFGLGGLRTGAGFRFLKRGIAFGTHFGADIGGGHGGWSEATVPVAPETPVEEVIVDGGDSGAVPIPSSVYGVAGDDMSAWTGYGNGGAISSDYGAPVVVDSGAAIPSGYSSGPAIVSAVSSAYGAPVVSSDYGAPAVAHAPIITSSEPVEGPTQVLERHRNEVQVHNTESHEPVKVHQTESHRHRVHETHEGNKVILRDHLHRHNLHNHVTHVKNVHTKNIHEHNINKHNVHVTRVVQPVIHTYNKKETKVVKHDQHVHRVVPNFQRVVQTHENTEQARPVVYNHPAEHAPAEVVQVHAKPVVSISPVAVVQSGYSESHHDSSSSSGHEGAEGGYKKL